MKLVTLRAALGGSGEGEAEVLLLIVPYGMTTDSGVQQLKQGLKGTLAVRLAPKRMPVWGREKHTPNDFTCNYADSNVMHNR